MRISDWSSDVCSSDLRQPRLLHPARPQRGGQPGARLVRTMDPRIAELVDFWRQVVADDRWMRKDPHFDRSFRERFLDQHMDAAARRCDDWIETPEGALALMVLLDQFPRNAFRGTAHMYATDGLARMFAREAERLGHMARSEEHTSELQSLMRIS